MKILASILMLFFAIQDLSSKDLEGLWYDGERRSYYLFNNEDIKPNDPLLIVIGAERSSYKEIEKFGFIDLAEKESFMICYPFEIPNDDSANYIKLLIKKLRKEYRIDRRKVYLTSLRGSSKHFDEIISHASKEIAAFTVFDEDLRTSKLLEENWNPSSILVLQNKISPVDKVLEIEELIDFNNSHEEAVRVERTDMIEGKVFDHFIHNGGIYRTSVEIVQISDEVLKEDFAEEIWGFLSGYKLGGLVIPREKDYVSKSVSIYPNPSYSLISIDFQSNDVKNVKFISPKGEKLIDENIAVYHYDIKLSEYPSGVYYLEINDEVYKVVKSQ